MTSSLRALEAKQQREAGVLERTSVGAIGSDEDKAVRKAAARLEPAWKGAGSAPDIKIWRTEDFQVIPVPLDTYGKFHEGDSYIILQTIEDPESSKLSHKIFFWLGKESSADERGTAAYKTVELDDFLDQEPSLHRESQRQGESDEFKALFPDCLEYLPGGCPTGFKHVVPEGHENKLYQVRMHKGEITIIRVPVKVSLLHQSDCFILDAAEKIYVLKGPNSSADEKRRAATKAFLLKNTRPGTVRVTAAVDDGFWSAFDGEKPAWAAVVSSDVAPVPAQLVVEEERRRMAEELERIREAMRQAELERELFRAQLADEEEKRRVEEERQKRMEEEMEEQKRKLEEQQHRMQQDFEQKQQEMQQKQQEMLQQKTESEEQMRKRLEQEMMEKQAEQQRKMEEKFEAKFRMMEEETNRRLKREEAERILAEEEERKKEDQLEQEHQHELWDRRSARCPSISSIIIAISVITITIIHHHHRLVRTRFAQATT